MDTVCAIPECQKPRLARGWCSVHYRRWQTHGDPLALGVKHAARFLRDTVLKHDGDDCLRWPFAHDGHGYGQVTQGGRVQKVTRIVCETVHGPAPSAKHEATHSCGNGHLGCCNPRHLRWATHAENMAEMTVHGSIARGTRAAGAKLTEADVRHIRTLKDAELQRETAERFGISASHVSEIQSKKTWAWVND